MNFIALSSQAKFLTGYTRHMSFTDPPAVGEWLPTAQIDEGLRAETCALERSDAPIRIGAQLGREGVQGIERALDRGAVQAGPGTRGRTHASAASKAPNPPPR